MLPIVFGLQGLWHPEKTTDLPQVFNQININYRDISKAVKEQHISPVENGDSAIVLLKERVGSLKSEGRHGMSLHTDTIS
jgi:hypothetical protein